MLPSPCVGLHADGNALSLNALLLEDALGDVRTLHMVRAEARSHIATSPHLLVAPGGQIPAGFQLDYNRNLIGFQPDSSRMAVQTLSLQLLTLPGNSW